MYGDPYGDGRHGHYDDVERHGHDGDGIHDVLCDGGNHARDCDVIHDARDVLCDDEKLHRQP